MMFAEFKRTLTHAKPPAGLSPALVALWWAGKDQWDEAHRIVMDADDMNAPGSMPICIALKATSAMQATGIGKRNVGCRLSR
jgi:hypothetical protein